jgi:hypothetical protein
MCNVSDKAAAVNDGTSAAALVNVKVELWKGRLHLPDTLLKHRRPLAPQHLADLHEKSGLSYETIMAAGFYSVEGAEAGRLLKWKGGGDMLGPCLVIPFIDQDGNDTGFARLKPDIPLAGKKKDGTPRPRKYEQPKDTPIRPYFPPGAWEKILDPAELLLITEGEKKAAAAAQAGFACVGLTGVDCWANPRPKNEQGISTGPRVLHDDLAALPLEKRLVVVAYDSDINDKPDVARAAKGQARQYEQRGARVLVLRLPAGPNGEKVGLDDYLLTHSAEELRTLIDAQSENLPLSTPHPPPPPYTGNSRDCCQSATGCQSATTEEGPPEWRLRELLGMGSCPPASACKRNPSACLYRAGDPGQRRVARLACGRWSCPVCCQRSADRWGLHLAAKAAGALQAGLLLWAVSATSETRKTVGGAVAKVTKKGGAYARVAVNDGYVWLVAAKEQPAPEAVPLAGADPLKAACGELGGWMKQVAGGGSAVSGRCHPITTSRAWRMAPRPKSDWRRAGPARAREVKTVLGVFAGAGVRPDAVKEDVGQFAWSVDWHLPEGWNVAAAERFEEVLADAEDPLRPQEPDDDGMTADDSWGVWGPPGRPVPDHEATAAVVCGVELSAGELEVFEEAKAAGELIVGPWTPLGSRVVEAWRRWCEQEHRPHRVREVSGEGVASDAA